MITFVNVRLDKGLITSEALAALLFMAVPSTMLTMPVVYPSLQNAKSLIFRKSRSGTATTLSPNPVRETNVTALSSQSKDTSP